MKALIASVLALLLLSTSRRVDAADVGSVIIAQSTRYAQGTTGAPVTKSVYQFSAFVVASGANVTSGDLRLPDGTLQTMPVVAGGPPSLDATFPTRTDLAAAYPNGTYKVKLVTAHDGSRDFVVTFPAGDFPAAPVVSDPSGLMAVDPGATLTVHWAPLGGTAQDYTQVQVRLGKDNTVFQTANPGEPGALDGTATSVSIPPGSLQPGQSYSLRILFAKVQGTGTGYAPSIAARSARTDLTLVTTGQVVDAAQVGVVAGAHFFQGATGAPVPDGPPYRFSMFVDSPDNGVIDGSMKLPGGSIQVFLAGNNAGIDGAFASAAALSAAYPPGNYEVSVNTVHNGVQKFPLSLPAAPYPAAPIFLNPGSLAAVNPAASLTVNWAPLADGAATDYVQASIDTPDDSSVYQTPQPNEPGVLNGNSVSFTFPAGVLDTGTAYRVRILYAKGNLTMLGPTLGIGAVYSQTIAGLATTGPSSAPMLTITQTGESQYKLHATGVNGRNYAIEGTSSLEGAVQWQSLVNYNGSPGGFDFNDGVVHGQYYYRVRSTN